MAKSGKISAIKKDYSNSSVKTMQSSLADSNKTRIPGTGVTKYPYKEISGYYRTGLDEDAAYIQRMGSEEAQKLEKARVKALREKLQVIFKVDLGPHSNFWNHALSTSDHDNTHVKGVKLQDGDNIFDFTNPWNELNFAWLRVHPTIASSHEAYIKGKYPADTQYYVVDDEVEVSMVYNKKKLINKAIVEFESMTPDRKKKVARLFGLPVNEDTTEAAVYSLVDEVLKQGAFKSGTFKGQDPIRLFNQFASLPQNVLDVKDLVKQALLHSELRIKQGGKIFKGEYELAKDEESLVEYLLDDNNQDQRIELEQKVRGKKLAAV